MNVIKHTVTGHQMPVSNGPSNGLRYSRMDRVKFFNGCLPQIFLGPFLNTLTQTSGSNAEPF